MEHVLRQPAEEPASSIPLLQANLSCRAGAVRSYWWGKLGCGTLGSLGNLGGFDVFFFKFYFGVFGPPHFSTGNNTVDNEIISGG